jgi:hypothetical protein
VAAGWAESAERGAQEVPAVPEEAEGTPGSIGLNIAAGLPIKIGLLRIDSVAVPAVRRIRRARPARSSS